MLKRTITGLLMVAMLMLILFLGEIVFGVVIAVFAVIAINELYKTTEKGHKPIKWISFLFAIPIIFYMFNTETDISQITLYAIAVIVFMICIMKPKKYSLIDGVITVCAGMIVFNMFYFLEKIYKIGADRMESAYLILFCLIGAFITDTFAYFVGVTIGKHKLCPTISPKKSVEGSIGGTLGVIIIMTLYGHFVLSGRVEVFAGVPFYIYAILGLICGIVSQIGDLFASMIKRHYDVKDYGNIFPGHGGVLDRFDSLVFVAPMVYFFINMIL